MVDVPSGVNRANGDFATASLAWPVPFRDQEEVIGGPIRYELACSGTGSLVNQLEVNELQFRPWRSSRRCADRRHLILLPPLRTSESSFPLLRHCSKRPHRLGRLIQRVTQMTLAFHTPPLGGAGGGGLLYLPSRTQDLRQAYWAKPEQSELWTFILSVFNENALLQGRLMPRCVLCV